MLFNGVLFFSHWPAVVELSVTSELAHFGLHVLLVGSALVMWWPIVSPLPEMPPLPAPGQMLYLFLESLAPTVPASFLTFGTRPLYPVYATFPRIWGIGVLTDQLDRRPHHEARRRHDPVGGDRRRLLPLGAP